MLASKVYEGRKVFYRTESSDERVLREVIEKKCYQRRSAGFDVERGERWLDLGANIGAFAVYCALRGAQAVCYEPEPECFKILNKNVPEFTLYNTAISALPNGALNFYSSPLAANYYRGTLIAPRSVKKVSQIKNKHAKFLCSQKFDGVKLDIEGSEGPLLDQWLLPRCKKIVFEYHTSRDTSMANFSRRMKQLRKRFEHVFYPAEFDRALERGDETYKAWNDRVIWAWGSR